MHIRPFADRDADAVVALWRTAGLTANAGFAWKLVSSGRRAEMSCPALAIWLRRAKYSAVVGMDQAVPPTLNAHRARLLSSIEID